MVGRAGSAESFLACDGLDGLALSVGLRGTTLGAAVVSVFGAFDDCGELLDESEGADVVVDVDGVDSGT